jgi:hypothetical protein
MERLAGKFIVDIGGFRYENAADHLLPGQPVSCEVERRDDEAARATLVVFDRVDPSSKPPYVEFNRFPNPRKVENIPFIVYGGWPDEGLVKMFEGTLIKKGMDEDIPSMTRFIAADFTYKLRKHARNDTWEGLTVKASLRKKGAEHGVNVQFDRTTANDPALNEPMEVYYQVSEPNWDWMLQYIRELGFVAVPKGRDILVVMQDKSAGRRLELRYGDDLIKKFALIEENKKSDRSPNRRGHHHETHAGRHAVYPNQLIVPNDSGKGYHWQNAPLAKDKKEHQHTLAKAAVLGKSRRRKREGDEADGQIRLTPWMVNHEIIPVSGYGPDIDGEYDTRMVRHVMGQEWTTYFEGWRP